MLTLEKQVRSAINPIEVPHESIVDESKHFGQFLNRDCTYIPQVICNLTEQLPSRVDPQGMTGGFAVCSLMSKVPGKHVVYDKICNKPAEE